MSAVPCSAAAPWRTQASPLRCPAKFTSAASATPGTPRAQASTSAELTTRPAPTSPRAAAQQGAAVGVQHLNGGQGRCLRHAPRPGAHQCPAFAGCGTPVPAVRGRHRSRCCTGAWASSSRAQVRQPGRPVRAHRAQARGLAAFDARRPQRRVARRWREHVRGPEHRAHSNSGLSRWATAPSKPHRTTIPSDRRCSVPEGPRRHRGPGPGCAACVRRPPRERSGSDSRCCCGRRCRRTTPPGACHAPVLHGSTAHARGGLAGGLGPAPLQDFGISPRHAREPHPGQQWNGCTRATGSATLTKRAFDRPRGVQGPARRCCRGATSGSA